MSDQNPQSHLAEDGTQNAQLFMQLNERFAAEFRANQGVVSLNQGTGAEVLLLHTKGRNTGADRMSPLGWVPIDEQMVIIASYGGGRNHPQWYYNLLADPDATIELGAETRDVRARITAGEERAQLFEKVTGRVPGFGDYQRSADRWQREIPVIVLEPR